MLQGTSPAKYQDRQRLYYDHQKPYTKKVKFYNHFIPESNKIYYPQAYIVPQQWADVINRLQWNGVQLTRIEKDTLMRVITRHINTYETVPHPYEKHYLHKNMQVTSNLEKIQLRKGDYIIPTAQPAKRYIAETLEPTAQDGFFAWGFFDGVLQQKESFSDYVFEDEAARLLENDYELKRQLLQKRAEDPAFAKDGAAQLDFVYRHSKYYEPTYMRYPVYRIEK